MPTLIAADTREALWPAERRADLLVRFSAVGAPANALERLHQVLH
jgi:hypothetical protein